MSPMNTNNQEQPKAVFAHTLMFPGVPLTSLLTTIGLLLNVYGVVHQIPIDPNVDAEALTTGDPAKDQRFLTEYVTFKNMLDGLSREYKRVVCSTQSNGIAVYMHLSCY